MDKAKNSMKSILKDKERFLIFIKEYPQVEKESMDDWKTNISITIVAKMMILRQFK
jgi:hypothetical protein